MSVIIRKLSVKHSSHGLVTVSLTYDLRGRSNILEMSGYNGVEEVLREICNILGVDFNKLEEYIPSAKRIR